MVGDFTQVNKTIKAWSDIINSLVPCPVKVFSLLRLIFLSVIDKKELGRFIIRMEI